MTFDLRQFWFPVLRGGLWQAASVHCPWDAAEQFGPCHPAAESPGNWQRPQVPLHVGKSCLLPGATGKLEGLQGESGHSDRPRGLFSPTPLVCCVPTLHQALRRVWGIQLDQADTISVLVCWARETRNRQTQCTYPYPRSSCVSWDRKPTWDFTGSVEVERSKTVGIVCRLAWESITVQETMRALGALQGGSLWLIVFLIFSLRRVSRCGITGSEGRSCFVDPWHLARLLYRCQLQQCVNVALIAPLPCQGCFLLEFC